jgi:translation initiation factor 3 subunit L
MHSNLTFKAVKVLENIELNKKSMYSRVPGCQISMYYYVGFAYMMMRRYADAIRTFSNILLYIQRTKGLFQVMLPSDRNRETPEFALDFFLF